MIKSSLIDLSPVSMNISTWCKEVENAPNGALLLGFWQSEDSDMLV